MKFKKNFHIPLIALAVLISLISSFGSILSITEPLLFIKIAVVEQSTYISTFRQTYFVENEWWRLITPILLHFSFPHLAFNCLWIYILGDKIERKDGTLKFIFLVFVSGILSGVVINNFDEDEHYHIRKENHQNDNHLHLKDRILSGVKYGFISLPSDIVIPLFKGLLVAAAISIFLPPDYIANHFASNIYMQFFKVTRICTKCYVFYFGDKMLAFSVLGTKCPLRFLYST